jgi:hypothetical protein
VLADEPAGAGEGGGDSIAGVPVQAARPYRTLVRNRRRGGFLHGPRWYTGP